LKLAELESASAAKFIRPTLGFKNQYGLNKFLFQPRMQTLMISGGRKDKLRAGDILGALTSNGDLQADEVGKIEISDHFSYVAISSKQAQKAFDCLREGKIKGRKFQIRMISIHGTL